MDGKRRLGRLWRWAVRPRTRWGLARRIRRATRNSDAAAWAFFRCLADVAEIPLDSEGDPWCCGEDITYLLTDFDRLRAAWERYRGADGREYVGQFRRTDWMAEQRAMSKGDRS